MNKKIITVSLLLISTSAFLMAGCGPLDANDAQVEQNIMSKDGDAPAQGPRSLQGMPQGPRAQAQAPGMQQGPGPQGPSQQGGCPAGGCPAAGGQQGGCPTGDCEIPPDADTYKAVQLPDQVASQPTVVNPTSEEQVATDTVDYHTTRHIFQPTVRQHVVNKHRHLQENYHTKVVYHPTFRRVNSITRTNSCDKQVTPVVEETAPPVDYGCSFASPCGGNF